VAEVAVDTEDAEDVDGEDEDTEDEDGEDTVEAGEDTVAVGMFNSSTSSQENYLTNDSGDTDSEVVSLVMPLSEPKLVSMLL
jgi:hypothetical protein